MNLFTLPTCEADAVEVFQNHGLLPFEKECVCGSPMRLSFGIQVRWRCTNRECRKSRGTRVRNWFKASRLPFLTILRFIYAWVYEYASVAFSRCELGMGADAHVDWANYMREVCVKDVGGLSARRIGWGGRA